MVRPPRSRYVVLGCGHTGTSLISGILHINGYGSFKVSQLFENIELNELNEKILQGARVDQAEISAFLDLLERKTGGRWSLKDPRFTETIHRFYPLLPKPVKIVFNYRHPGATVKSLIAERELHESHLTRAEMLKSAEDEWLRRNRAVLEFLDRGNNSPVLIVRYDDLVERQIDEHVCRFAGFPLDLSLIEPRMRRSSPIPVRQELVVLYQELNDRFEQNRAQILSRTKPVRVKRHGRRRSARTRLYVGSNRALNSARSRWSSIQKLRRPHDGRQSP